MPGIAEALKRETQRLPREKVVRVATCKRLGIEPFGYLRAI